MNPREVHGALTSAREALLVTTQALADSQIIVVGALTDVEDALDSVSPKPPIRPITPEGFTAATLGETVELDWAFPLPPETSRVQVHRRPAFKPEGEGWVSLTKEALDGWSDEGLPRLPQGTRDTRWEYRIRGCMTLEDGTFRAGSWSEVLAVPDVDREPSPGPGPSPSTRALDRVGNTVEQNKAWRAPAMIASRTGRQAIGGLGDVKTGEWTEGDLVWSNKASTNPAPPSGQWNSNMHVDYDPRPGSYTWENIECTGEIKDVFQTNLLWGAREHCVPERYILDCDYSWMKEHGMYISPQDDQVVRRSTFVNVGAQGLQYAHRPVARSSAYRNNRSWDKEPTFIVDDCHMIDCGKYAGRGSFSLTYFSCGSVNFPGTIQVTNSSFVAKWDEPNTSYFGDYYSTGAMVASTDNWDDGNVWTGGCQYKLIVLKNNLNDYTTPDRSILSLRSFDNLRIEDCAFIIRDNKRSKAALKIDAYVDDPTIKAKRLTLRNVSAEGLMGKVQGAGAFSMHCPGEEVVIDARTGNEISRRTL